MSCGIAKCKFDCIFNKEGLCTNKIHTYAEGRTDEERKKINEQSEVIKCPHRRTKL